MMARAKVSLSNLLDREDAEADVPSEPPAPAVSAPDLASPEVPADTVATEATEGEPPVVEDRPLSVVGEQVPTTAPTTEPEDVVTEPQPAPEDAPPAAATKPVHAVEPKATKTRSSGAVRSIKAAPEPPPLPLYLDLTRKEARFRPDQLNDLTTLTRQINRRRASTGERITDNTLIRVAVDMLLRVADSLDGATEADLLQSVGSRLR